MPTDRNRYKPTNQINMMSKRKNDGADFSRGEVEGERKTEGGMAWNFARGLDTFAQIRGEGCSYNLPLYL
jgi:hypothetical protein